jgi:hypothetical protein
MKYNNPESNEPIWQYVVNPTGTELTIRHGEAEKIVYEKSISISGILAAPYQFYEGKKPEAKDCHIQIKKDAGVIALHIRDTDPHSGSVITGQLKNDGYFQQWGINTEKRWTVSAFLKHIKMQRAFFTEKSETDAMVSSLQKWNAKVEVVMKQHNDNAGNSLSLLERTVSDIELKNKFSLTIPIFQGYPKQKFTVEIGLDPKSNSVELYLFSNDLFELEINHREQLIEAEIAKFKDFPCSKVVIS